MRYSVDDFVGSITLEQRDELDRVLKPGELILWATRPRAGMLHPWQKNRLSFYLFVIPFLVFGVYGGARVMFHFLPQLVNGEGGCMGVFVRLLLFLPGASAFLLSGRRLFSMICVFFGIRRYRRHTLYVLTERRAISLELRPEGWVTRSYTLDENMLLERRETVAGGELIFRLEGNLLPGEEGVRLGWTALEDAAEAEARVRAALERREKRREGVTTPSEGSCRAAVFCSSP